MEVNGVANIKMIIDSAKEADLIHPQIAADIAKQLLLLERYMLAYADHKTSIKAGAYGALVVGTEEPMWHEIRENPEQYPTGSERMQNYKKQMGR